MAEQTESQKVQETLNPNANDKNLNSEEATLESDSGALGGTESTVTNHNAAETSASASDVDCERSLEHADELLQQGYKAMKENDFSEAAENFSRALEIRVAKFGELAPECVHTYYKYGCALLYKAQEEADPLADVPKKEGESQEGSTKDGSVKNSAAESSTTSISSNAEQDVNSNNQDAALDDASTKEDQEDDKDSDDEDLAEGDEDESDLDLAWKMLDIARAIGEKHSSNTLEHVDILSALADVALEREDFETSLSDYKKALSILEQLVEPDNRKIADLNFRICLCLEVNSKPQEAMSYCQKAVSVCKERIYRLANEVKSLPESDNSIADKQAEIDTLTGLSSELERKLEDLQQLISNPKSILSEILGLAAAKVGAGRAPSSSGVSSSQMATANSSGGFDSPTVSTGHSNGSTGVTHLGVVGRGVKRTSSASMTEANPMKKPSLESSSDNNDGRTS
ncbi:nuclear autoantigenic sperm protein isoform X2 [Neltuma alba]|uniref:nuclear autoantigenic sperm protein isoform X2 n=1 Tax=Neltuma alba TaxID=207710 RepID=UPI0010A3D57E|nr:nuclear autoantigenic sperm protein isoform X2 [Prosopis alba]